MPVRRFGLSTAEDAICLQFTVRTQLRLLKVESKVLSIWHDGSGFALVCCSGSGEQDKSSKLQSGRHLLRDGTRTENLTSRHPACIPKYSLLACALACL